MKQIKHSKLWLKSVPFRCRCERPLQTDPRKGVCECGIIYDILATSDPARVMFTWTTTEAETEVSDDKR